MWPKRTELLKDQVCNSTKTINRKNKLNEQRGATSSFNDGEGEKYGRGKV